MNTRGEAGAGRRNAGGHTGPGATATAPDERRIPVSRIPGPTPLPGNVFLSCTSRNLGGKDGGSPGQMRMRQNPVRRS